MKRKRIIYGCLALVITLGCCQWSYAALGGSADTIAADSKAHGAVRRSSVAYSGYTVEEVVSEASTVREYLSPSGMVFGIAWSGYVHPDLSQFLGFYWDEYSAALQKSGRKYGSKRQRLTTENIVVERWGHMRNLRGRAYLPGLLPAGVNIDDIK